MRNSSKHRWTPAEEARLAYLAYQEIPNREIAERLGLPLRAVQRKRTHMGITGSAIMDALDGGWPTYKAWLKNNARVADRPGFAAEIDGLFSSQDELPETGAAAQTPQAGRGMPEPNGDADNADDAACPAEYAALFEVYNELRGAHVELAESHARLEDKLAGAETTIAALMDECEKLSAMCYRHERVKRRDAARAKNTAQTSAALLKRELTRKYEAAAERYLRGHCGQPFGRARFKLLYAAFKTVSMEVFDKALGGGTEGDYDQFRAMARKGGEI